MLAMAECSTNHRSDLLARLEVTASWGGFLDGLNWLALHILGTVLCIIWTGQHSVFEHEAPAM